MLTVLLRNIILLHGLRGDPTSTWEKVIQQKSTRGPLLQTIPGESSDHAGGRSRKGTCNRNRSPTTTVLWPRDHLPETIPNVRVLTYGYNTDVMKGLFEEESQNNILQHAHDLLHSLLNEQTSIHQRTKCVLFFGTPHREPRKAGLVARLSSVLLQNPNRKLLEALDVGGEVLDGTQNDFLNMLHSKDFKVHSFQESKDISGVKGFCGKPCLITESVSQPDIKD
ncbi:hypothetical protein BDD12DRAFT_795951 [Trichophaea hybrida]|nr:hypothetical protein BDD12DRAFT_795951 [Trichophaea hybrida]